MSSLFSLDSDDSLVEEQRSREGGPTTFLTRCHHHHHHHDHHHHHHHDNDQALARLSAVVVLVCLAGVGNILVILSVILNRFDQQDCANIMFYLDIHTDSLQKN